MLISVFSILTSVVLVPKRNFSAVTLSDAEFDKQWIAYFDDKTFDGEEIRRGLNDVFAHDLIPSKAILEAALKSTRRINDFPT